MSKNSGSVDVGYYLGMGKPRNRWSDQLGGGELGRGKKVFSIR